MRLHFPTLLAVVAALLVGFAAGSLLHLDEDPPAASSAQRAPEIVPPSTDGRSDVDPAPPGRRSPDARGEREAEPEATAVASRVLRAAQRRGITPSVPTDDGSIRGIVRLVDGTPIAGATVRVVPLRAMDDGVGWDARGTSDVGRAYREPPPIEEELARIAADRLEARRAIRLATTGEDGRFTVEGLRGGRHSVSAHAEDVDISGTTAWTGAEIALEGRRVLEHRLDLRLDSGVVPERALLEVSDRDNTWEHAWTSAEPVLRTTRTGLRVVALAGEIVSSHGDESVAEWKSEEVALDDPVNGPQTVRLVRHQVLAVTVREGWPTPGSRGPWVKLMARDGAPRDEGDWESVDALRPVGLHRGAWLWTGLPHGDYVLGAGRGDGRLAVSREVQVGPGTTEVTLELPPPDESRHLIVRCWSPDGSPACDVRFECAAYRKRGNARWGTASAAEREPGTFWIPHPELFGKGSIDDFERVRLTATSTAYGSRSVELDPAASRVELRFAEPASLEVEVQGPWAPGDEVMVQEALTEDGRLPMVASKHRARVTAAGRVAFEHLQPGRHEVFLLRAARERGYLLDEAPFLGRSEVDVRAGSNAFRLVVPTRHDVAIQAPGLAKGVSFRLRTGRWTRDVGFPEGRSAHVDGEGRALFRDVPAGTYTLFGPGSGASPVEVVVPCGPVMWDAKTQR